MRPSASDLNPELFNHLFDSISSTSGLFTFSSIENAAVSVPILFRSALFLVFFSLNS